MFREPDIIKDYMEFNYGFMYIVLEKAYECLYVDARAKNFLEAFGRLLVYRHDWDNLFVVAL